MPDDGHDCAFLRDVLPESQVAFQRETREAHGTDRGTAPIDAGRLPDAVVFVESTEDVSTVLAAANERGVSVTPYAAGTGLEGGAVPSRGGISLDLTRLDAVLDVRPEDRQIDVQAGVLGGTATGEHGVGLDKCEFMVREHREASVEAMRAIKRALDPNGVLNPGKVFPETTEGGRARADSDDLR